MAIRLTPGMSVTIGMMTVYSIAQRALDKKLVAINIKAITAAMNAGAESPAVSGAKRLRMSTMGELVLTKLSRNEEKKYISSSIHGRPLRNGRVINQMATLCINAVSDIAWFKRRVAATKSVTALLQDC